MSVLGSHGNLNYDQYVLLRVASCRGNVSSLTLQLAHIDTGAGWSLWGKDILIRLKAIECYHSYALLEAELVKAK